MSFLLKNLRVLDTARLDEFFDHTGMADNFRGKTMTVVAGCFGFHHTSLPKAG